MAAKGKICVSIAAADPDRALALAAGAVDRASVLEIRLDALTRPVVAPFVEQLEVPLLFTCRPSWEGGNFAGTEEERFALLAEAARGGAAYVDIELRADEEFRRQLLDMAGKHQVKVIVSWHDFKTTASAQALRSIFEAEYRSGGDIGKIVTTARNFQDVLRVLTLQDIAAEMGFPLCAFCMGRAGMISRIATLELGGFMTYAAPDHGPATAPGQLSVSALGKALECFDEDH
ncbi:MAG: type I 3-dehydroquinate dehydratase [Desulfobulbales bacterium]|nr:type I 3-dehydroquinate dehydratase [Desulfobulbales bacterium]